MTMLVLVCGNVFDGLSDSLTGPAEILIEGNRISKVERSMGRPPGARVIDLAERTASPGFIDTHVHFTMDAANLALQTLQSSAAKALKGGRARWISRRGTVTLPCEERERSTPYGFSSRRDGLAPRGHRRGA